MRNNGLKAEAFLCIARANLVRWIIWTSKLFFTWINALYSKYKTVIFIMDVGFSEN